MRRPVLDVIYISETRTGSYRRVTPSRLVPADGISVCKIVTENELMLLHVFVYFFCLILMLLFHLLAP